MKTQTIRLADVFVVGPVMLWGANKLAQRGDKALGGALGLLGLLTIAYNGGNYLDYAQQRRRENEEET